MISWFKSRFKATGPWKHIGYMDFQTNLMKENGEAKRLIHHRIAFMMNDSGGRKLVLPKYDRLSEEQWTLERHPMRWEADVWAQGGPFPSSFKPEPDTLKKMLIRLIDDELLGENKE